MKFLHTADLHIGKTLNNFSFLEDQRYILDRISHIASEEKVDAILIAGDVYQRSSPQAEAMALFDGFVTGLTSNGIRVFMISGNHDSEQRIAYFSELLRTSGVYTAEKFNGTLQKVELRDAHGPVDIWLMPFLRPANVRMFYPAKKITGYTDALRTVLDSADIDRSRRNVLLCHQFIIGSETSDSEENSLGGLDQVDPALFDAFDYTALGHIHKPQVVRRGQMLYAGSPLKYSLSEVDQTKSVTIVNLSAKGDITLKNVPLTPMREMRCIDGTLESVMAMPTSEDYVWITVHDDLVPPDAAKMFDTQFPNMMRFTVQNEKTRTDLDVTAAEDIKNKTEEELFMEFYALQNNGVMPTDAHMAVIRDILRQKEGSRDEAR